MPGRESGEFRYEQHIVRSLFFTFRNAQIVINTEGFLPDLGLLLYMLLTVYVKMRRV